MLSRRQSSLKLITFEGEPRVLWNGSHPVGRGVHPYHDIHKTRLLTHLSSPIDRNFWKYFQSQPGPAGQIKSELWQVVPITSRARYWLAFVFVCHRLGAATSDALAWSHHPSAGWSSASCLVVVMSDDDRDDQAVPHHWLLFACRDADWMIRWMMIE